MKAVLHTCRAMQASLPGKADGQHSALGHCERASGHLWSSLTVTGTSCDPTLNHVSPLGRLPTRKYGERALLPIAPLCRSLWCIVVALHVLAVPCNVPAVHPRGLPGPRGTSILSREGAVGHPRRGELLCLQLPLKFPHRD